MRIDVDFLIGRQPSFGSQRSGVSANARVSRNGVRANRATHAVVGRESKRWG